MVSSQLHDVAEPVHEGEGAPSAVEALEVPHPVVGLPDEPVVEPPLGGTETVLAPPSS